MKTSITQQNQDTFFAKCIKIGIKQGIYTTEIIEQRQLELINICNKSIQRTGITDTLQQTIKQTQQFISICLDIGLEHSAEKNSVQGAKIIKQYSLEKLFNHGFNLLIGLQKLGQEIYDKFWIGEINWFPTIRDQITSQSQQEEKERAEYILSVSKFDLIYFIPNLTTWTQVKKIFTSQKEAFAFLEELAGTSIREQIRHITQTAQWENFIITTSPITDIYFIIATILVNDLQTGVKKFDFLTTIHTLDFLEKIKKIHLEGFLQEMEFWFKINITQKKRNQFNGIFQETIKHLHQYTTTENEATKQQKCPIFLHEITIRDYLLYSPQNEEEIQDLCNELACSHIEHASNLLAEKPPEITVKIIKYYTKNFDDGDKRQEIMEIIRKKLLFIWNAKKIASIIRILDNDKRKIKLASYKNIYNKKRWETTKFLRKRKRTNMHTVDQAYLEQEIMAEVFQCEIAKEIFLAIPFISMNTGKRIEVKKELGIIE